MNTLIQHAKLAIRMNNNGINREFIKKFPIEEIIDCCNRIEQNKILNDEYKDIIPEMLKHLRYSQIEKLSKKYDLRPGMGLAAPQLGINKNFFVVCYEVKDGVFDDYILINPKVISYSEEMIYAGEGEGCLSVNREVEGIVPRHARITVEAYDLDGNKHKYRVREDLAIAFQHELDHLNGILFVDYIDPKDPYKNAELYREI